MLAFRLPLASATLTVKPNHLIVMLVLADKTYAGHVKYDASTRRRLHQR